MKTHLIIGLSLALTAPIFAQQKVSERTSLAAAALAPATDILPIVDISAGLSGSKKITIDDLFTGWGFTAAGEALAKAEDADEQRTALGLGTAATAAATTFEAALGNPGTNGYVLSSTTAGVRSWIAPGAGGGDIASQSEAEAGTDNTKTMTPLRTSQAISALGLTSSGGGVANFDSGLTAAGAEITSLSAESLYVTEDTTLTGNITFALPGSATGDILFRNASGKIERLGIGTSGQYLKVDSGYPSWATFAGGGGDLLSTNNLSDLASASTARTNLGLGTAAVLAHGTAAGNLVRLDATTGKLPAVDGSLLTNLPAAGDLLAANNLSDLASAATARTNLGLAIGSDVQAFAVPLNNFGSLADPPDNSGYTLSSDDSGNLSWVLRGDMLKADNLSGLANYTTARSNLGLAIGTDVQAYDADLSSWAAVTRAAGFDTLTTTPSSANLRALLTDEEGTGAAYFVGGGLGTPASGTLTNATGLPLSGIDQSSATTGQVATWNGSVWVAATPGSLANFTESVNTSTPNATIPAVRLVATNAATNVDAVFSPKGTGGILANIPDNTAVGGNKRGTNAVDWQQVRSTNTMVASGTRSTIGGGQNNSATQDYCVVGGGSSNNCRGSGSVIAGGSGNMTTASTASQTIGGGASNETTQPYATVGGGRSNTASGQDATVVGGGSNDATGAASVAGGWDNTASGTSATAFGWGNTASGGYSAANGFQATTRGLLGMSAHAAGYFAAVGDAQRGVYVMRRSTSSATGVELTLDGGSSGRLILPNNSTYSFTGQVAARSSTGDSATWRFSGTIERGVNAAATALVGTPTLTDTNAEAGASAWTIAITADTTNGALVITATGAASTNIRWVAQVETAEVTY
jgi:hypothetical protein